MFNGYVYKIVNNKNDILYIGNTVKNLKERFRCHINDANRTKNSYFYNEFIKIGFENFEIKPIIKLYDDDKNILKQKLYVEEQKEILKCVENNIELYNVYFNKNNYKYLHMNIKVDQFDLNNNFIKTHDSARSIKRNLNYDSSTITKCCKNKLKKAYNFIWRYHV